MAVGGKRSVIGRRKALKILGAGSVAGLAGCTGGGDGGDGGSTPASTSTPMATEDPNLSPEEQLAEWRKKASEEAAKELQGGEKLNFYTSSRDQAYLAARTTELASTLEQTWVEDADLYEPLVDSINNIQGSRGDLVTRYAQENQSGNQIMDLLDGGAGSAIAEGVPFGDVSQVPTTSLLPDGVIVEYDGKPLQVGQYLFPFGVAYNTEEASFAPETYEDVLDPEFSNNSIIADFTPPPDSAIPVLLTQGEDYLKSIADQKPQFVESLFDQVRKTAQGDAKLAWQCLGAQAIQFQNDGLPIELASNNKMWKWAAQWMQFAEEPAHPWAARLFADFLIRPEHKHIQTGRIGSLSLDTKAANPNNLLELFNPEENQIWSAGKYDKSVNELLDQYLEAIGAPV